MKLFKRALLSLGFLAFIGMAHAEQPEYVEVCNSTDTAASICAINEVSYVYGVMFSGVSTAAYVVLRDSNTANVTSATKTIVYANDGTDTVKGSSLFEFKRPIIFTGGITANLSASAGGGEAEFVHIFYRSSNK